MQRHLALEISIRALGLSGEVIVPSFTFIATAHALQWQEITPVFCDVDPETHNLDPAKVEALITPRTTGIIGVHVWGRPCAVESLQEIAHRHGLKLMFDAAHAFGCSHNGQMIGNFGQAEVFSFHATKFFNTFEGGAVVTNDDDLAAKMRLMKNFGFTGYDQVIYVGTNGKMSEVSAAMGLTGLEDLDEFINTNHRNYKTYQNGLQNVPGIQLISYDEAERNNFQYIIVEVDEAVAGLMHGLCFSGPDPIWVKQHARQGSGTNVQANAAQEGQQGRLADVRPVAESGHEGVGGGAEPTTVAGWQGGGDGSAGAGDVPDLAHEADDRDGEVQPLHKDVRGTMAHGIGRQGSRVNDAALLVGDDEGVVLLGFAARRAGATLGFRGVVSRRRRRWGGRLEVRLARTSLQPCVLITQILVFNPQGSDLCCLHLYEVEQLDHDLTGCQIGDGCWIDVRNLHIPVVYQTIAVPSPTAQRLWRGYLYYNAKS